MKTLFPATILFSIVFSATAGLSATDGIVLGGAGALVTRGGAREAEAVAQVHATDVSGNYTSIGETNWLGGTGGEGWGENHPWQAFSEPQSNIQTTFQEEEDLELCLETHSEQGTAIVGRYLPTPLVSGSYQINAWLDGGEDFVGFAVWGNGGELFRYGYWDNMEASQAGYYYFTSEHPDGVFFCEGALSTTPATGIEYELTWQQVGQGLEFTMAENTGTWEAEALASLTVEVVGATAVDAIAIIATGDKRVAFSMVDVTGTPAQSVPEPGTLALVALGAAVLGARQRRG